MVEQRTEPPQVDVQNVAVRVENAGMLVEDRQRSLGGRSCLTLLDLLVDPSDHFTVNILKPFYLVLFLWLKSKLEVQQPSSEKDNHHCRQGSEPSLSYQR